MTAEIVILNRNAVAIAADSAVTVRTPNGAKTYNSANKLFTLSKYHPVAVMIYGAADMTGIPWETIIKLYRQKLGNKKFQNISGYARNFISYIENKIPVDDRDNDLNIMRILADGYHEVVRDIETRVRVSGHKYTNDVAEFVIENFSRVCRGEDFNRSVNGVRSSRVNINKVRKIARPIVEGIFSEYDFSDQQKRILLNLAKDIVFRNFSTDSFSGIVFVGYGESDIYPSMISYRSDGLVFNKFKNQQDQKVVISSETSSAVCPFAQGEMVYRFMEGMDPDYQRFLEAAFGVVMARLPDEIMDALWRGKSEKKEKIKASLKSTMDNIQKDFVKSARKYRQDIFVSPVLGAIHSLHKEDLSVLAESLVHLTSLKRRVSLDLESVGGPIDVAVISKGDGFIWMKRKHYFDYELNRQFMYRYYDGSNEGG